MLRGESQFGSGASSGCTRPNCSETAMDDTLE
jgi:hypothetical protein